MTVGLLSVVDNLPQELASLSILARLLVNQSPEPFSNILLSLFEDVVAVGGSYAAVAHPLAVLAVVAAFLGLFTLLARRIYRRLRGDPARPRNSGS